jgi:GPI transamidase subunit PIG-U
MQNSTAPALLQTAWTLTSSSTIFQFSAKWRNFVTQQVLDSSAHVLQVADLSPNIGLQWYFFQEMPISTPSGNLHFG